MKYALLFPGQGSQAVGALDALTAVDRRVRDVLREASHVLNWDIERLLREGPTEELNRTERTQPVLLAASVAVAQLWRALRGGGVTPSVLAGHSLGEYSALTVAGSLDFAEALRLVELRGQLMQQAASNDPGGMAAVLGLDDAGIATLCAAFPGPGRLEPANYNAPGQVVVAGPAAALSWLQAHGKEHGARKVIPLQVSVPSHCSLMRPAAERLAETLSVVPIRPPTIPVLHNLNAQPSTDPETIRSSLLQQLYCPVRWTQTIEAICAQGVTTFLECGPGRVLTGLVKRIAPEATTFALEDPQQLHAAIEFVDQQGLAQ
jgi:[acyl-carrier-protein] S-malonyltransferase